LGGPRVILGLRSTQFEDINRACTEEAFVYEGIGCILGWEASTTYLE
jgi:hypothetical protein